MDKKTIQLSHYQDINIELTSVGADVRIYQSYPEGLTITAKDIPRLINALEGVKRELIGPYVPTKEELEKLGFVQRGEDSLGVVKGDLYFYIERNEFIKTKNGNPMDNEYIRFQTKEEFLKVINNA
jgi:hypothetical protein